MSTYRDVLFVEVACDRHAPAAVRAALIKTFEENWPIDDAVLVASELVTNAVRHSGGEGTQLLTVDVRLRDGGLLISVHDPGASGGTARPSTDGDRPGGWGLRIIDRLSTRWGADRPDGYRVWAELAIPPDAVA